MGGYLSSPTPESSVGKLTSISKSIEEKTKVLTESLLSQGLQAPSFHPDGLADFELTEADSIGSKARLELVALTKELHDLVVGPREGLKNLAWDSVSYIPLQAIYEFRVAEAVPRHGSISYGDLAKKVEVVSSVRVAACDLRRLLRLAMLNNVFCEPEQGFVAHNRTSLLFLEDETLANWVGMFTTDLLTPIANTVTAMRKWPESQESNQTGVNVAFDHTSAFFDHLQEDKSRAKRYGSAMQAQSSREGYDVSHTVESYPWSKLGTATIVDMGGSQGFISIALANAFPLLSFIVQDLPGMRTPSAIGTVPGTLADRLSLTTHDFFQPQPVVAEAYLFRHVFHAFSDKYAVSALQALVPALKKGSRVIINDYVLPPPGTVSRAEEKSLRTMDVLMKTVCNSREREEADWRNLFEMADERFKWQGAWKSSGKLSFIECTWDD